MLGLGASDFEFGVDPSADPELALVSRQRWRAAAGTQLHPSELCPAQLPACARLRRLCASPWRSRGSGKRRRPGGLQPPLRLRLGLLPLVGTVRSWAGIKAGRDRQGVPQGGCLGSVLAPVAAFIARPHGAVGSVSVHGGAFLCCVAVPRAAGVRGERRFLPRNVGGRQFNCNVLRSCLCFA